MKKGIVAVLLAILIGFVLAAIEASAQKAGVAKAAESCDQTLWSHVYHRERLIVKQKCISVAGVIVDATHQKRYDGLRREADGDCHAWLKIDPGEQEKLLNAGNISAEGGNLVFEVVCMFPVTQEDAKTACLNYKNKIVVPPIGSHVLITGSYVEETNHARWRELHPVTSIKVLE